MKNWYAQNENLLLLLQEKQTPTPEEVINARNTLWDKGHNVDLNLFGHLIELAVLHQSRKKDNKDTENSNNQSQNWLEQVVEAISQK